MKNLDEFQKFGSDGVDVMLKQFGAVSKGVQAIASEVADYSKEAFETTAAAAEKLIGAKSLGLVLMVMPGNIMPSARPLMLAAWRMMFSRDRSLSHCFSTCSKVCATR